MKTLKDIEALEGVKVLVRADFNVPVMNGQVLEAFRIEAAAATIDYLESKGAKVILISHIECTNGKDGTLEPVAKYMSSLGRPVTFIKDWRQAHEQIENMQNGQCIILENIRQFDGEKKNDPEFAKELASLADIYVNEAFSVSHRPHASVIGLPKIMPAYAGIQMEKEIASLSRAFDPLHPFVFILGGAKFETKIPLLRKFQGKADVIVLAGALANDAYKARGYEVGKSLVSSAEMDIRPIIDDPKVVIPEDALTQEGISKQADSLSPSDKIMDAGPKTIQTLSSVIPKARFILWNGPLGMYEQGFTASTLALAKLIGEATSNGAVSIVGGGDTLASIDTLGMGDKFTFRSTGGGAMLDFLASGTLPGIEALES